MALKGKKKIPISSAEDQATEESHEGEQEHLRDADFSQLAKESGEQAELSDDELLSDSDSGEDDSSAIQKQLKKTQEEVEENKKKYLRALADLENYKKRVLKERSELLKYQGEKVFIDILDVVDNLELALQHSDAEPEKFKDGVVLIHKLFMDVLSKWQVRAESGIGSPFDPNRHAALSRIPQEGVEPGTIVDELKKAYFYKDRLLRAGEVVVASEPEGDQDSSLQGDKDQEE